MNNPNKYLIIPDFVYYTVCDRSIFFYNTISGKSLLIEGSSLIDDLIECGLDGESSVFLVGCDIISKEEFSAFMLRLDELFIGHLVEAACMPFVFNRRPILKNVSENNIDGDYHRDVVSSLFEITFFINSLSDVPTKYTDLHKQILFPVVSLKNYLIDKRCLDILQTIDTYYKRNINLIIGDLNNLNIDESHLSQNNCTINGYLYFKTILEARDMVLLNKMENVIVYIDDEISSDQLLQVTGKLSNAGVVNVHFYALVGSESEFESLEKLRAETDMVFSYQPYFYQNEDFFIDNVYMEEEDILGSGLSMNEIHQRLLVNVNNYGKLSVLFNADVYSNINNSPIGNLLKDDVKSIIYSELNTPNSPWYAVRKIVNDCMKCIYNGLCPPISNYEFYLANSTFCKVRSKAFKAHHALESPEVSSNFTMNR